MEQLELVEKPKLLKLDFGCGKNVREGFDGVDIRDFGQKYKLDLSLSWPFEDNSVEEAHASHFVEHLDTEERIHFVNELYRVLIPNGKCQVIIPPWSSCRAYGDLTHKWPPVSEFWFHYLNKEWRNVNAPHNDFYKCNFNISWGFNMHPEIAARNQEYQMHAITFFKEAAQDIVATFIKIGE